MTGADASRRGATFLEVAATMTIIGLFAGLVVFSSRPFATVATDAQAKSRLQQSLAIVDAVRSSDGGTLESVEPGNLSTRSDGFTFVTGTTGASATTVSLITATSATEEKVAVATLTTEGACWYATIDFKASVVANAPLVVAVRPAGGTSACTAAVALTLVPVGAVGRAWDAPVNVD